MSAEDVAVAVKSELDKREADSNRKQRSVNYD